MIETNIKDRIPTYPGRVQLKPVDGQPNTYDMTRADAPIEEGTPINKSTLESFATSRLVGRYYPLRATYTEVSSATYTTSPLPTSWTVSTDFKTGTFGSISIDASSATVGYDVSKAFDGNASTQWTSGNDTWHELTVTFPTVMALKKFKIQAGASTNSFKLSVRGSNTQESWRELYTVTSIPTTQTEYTINNNEHFRYYKFVFTTSSAAAVSIKDITMSEWTIKNYNAEYQADRMPATWDNGQRVYVEVPELDPYSLASNTFVGKPCNSLLQAKRRYELIYNGNSFDAKEV